MANVLGCGTTAGGCCSICVGGAGTYCWDVIMCAAAAAASVSMPRPGGTYVAAVLAPDDETDGG